MQSFSNSKLNSALTNLIKSFKYLHNEKEIGEIDSLINFYLEQKLDEAITKAETNNNYNAEIYEQCLNERTAKK